MVCYCDGNKTSSKTVYSMKKTERRIRRILEAEKKQDMNHKGAVLGECGGEGGLIGSGCRVYWFSRLTLRPRTMMDLNLSGTPSQLPPSSHRSVPSLTPRRECPCYPHRFPSRRAHSLIQSYLVIYINHSMSIQWSLRVILRVAHETLPRCLNPVKIPSTSPSSPSRLSAMKVGFNRPMAQSLSDHN